MAERFKQVKKGGELKKALDTYTQYLSDANSRQTRRLTGQGTPGTRGKSQSVGIRLFGADMAADKYIISRVSEAALGASGANFDNVAGIGTGTDKRAEYTIDEADVVAEPTGFKKAARLTVFVPNAEASRYVRSKFTGLYYIKYGGKSFTTPFGRKQNVDGTTERFADARAQMLAALKGDGPGQFTRVSIREEDYDGNA